MPTLPLPNTDILPKQYDYPNPLLYGKNADLYRINAGDKRIHYMMALRRGMFNSGT